MNILTADCDGIVTVKVMQSFSDNPEADNCVGNTYDGDNNVVHTAAAIDEENNLENTSVDCQKDVE